MSIFTSTANCLWNASLIKKAIYFHQNFSHFQRIQEINLIKLIKNNQATEFGKFHHFKTIRSIKEYQQKIPLRTYQDFLPWIEKCVQGESNVLTQEDIKLFEPTSGTSGGTKLIPYTNQLKREFQMAISPWILDIYKNFPELLNGRSYWSITPISHDKTFTPGHTPIGFEEDSQYLGWISYLMNWVFAVPQEIKHVKKIENYWYLTAYFLIHCRELTLLSFWNPSLLKILLEKIEEKKLSLIKDVLNGTITLPEKEDIQFKPYISNPKLARLVQDCLQSDSSSRYKNLWPKLRFISLWTEGSARHHAREIYKLFPGLVFQPKGLLSTEGIISFPLYNLPGHIPAYTSHFLEFLVDDQVFHLAELEKNQSYSVVLTNGGGLYRYKTNDVIKVIGFYKNMPLFKFLGREKYVDIVGEKLNETFVASILNAHLKKYNDKLSFVMISPEFTKNGGYYILYLKLASTVDEALKLKFLIENGLRNNYHYDYARKNGQLKELKLFMIKGEPMQVFFKRNQTKKLGDIKPILLDKKSEWYRYFKGEFI